MSRSDPMRILTWVIFLIVFDMFLRELLILPGPDRTLLPNARTMADGFWSGFQYTADQYSWKDGDPCL